MTFRHKLSPKILKIFDSLSTTVLCHYDSKLHFSKFRDTGNYAVIEPENSTLGVPPPYTRTPVITRLLLIVPSVAMKTKQITKHS